MSHQSNRSSGNVQITVQEWTLLGAFRASLRTERSDETNGAPSAVLRTERSDATNGAPSAVLRTEPVATNVAKKLLGRLDFSRKTNVRKSDARASTPDRRNGEIVWQGGGSGSRRWAETSTELLERKLEACDVGKELKEHSDAHMYNRYMYTI